MRKFIKFLNRSNPRIKNKAKIKVSEINRYLSEVSL